MVTRVGFEDNVETSQFRSRITVSIVEDHLMVAEGLARIIDREGDLELLGVAGSVAEAMSLIERQVPQVVLMDYQLPDGDGAEATEQILLRWPDTKVLMLSGNDGKDIVIRAIKAGCVGFIAKTRPAGDVVRAVRWASVGELMVRKDELAALFKQMEHSTLDSV
jgi:DNA-binding NarL/FixJ family response regulator